MDINGMNTCSNLVELNNTLVNIASTIDDTLQKNDTGNYKATLQKLEELLKNNQAVIEKIINLDTVKFIKAAKNLSHSIKDTGQNALFLDTAMKAAVVSLNNLSKDDIGNSMHVLNALKESDESFYNQSVADWVNTQQIPIKELGLSKDKLLEIAPLLTYLDLTDGEYCSYGISKRTFTDNFIGNLLEKTEKLTHLIIRNSDIKSALARLKNTESVQVLIIDDCLDFDQSLPEKLSNLKQLIITSCWNFNKPLPSDLSNLQELRIENCDTFDQPLPEKLPNLQRLKIFCCDDFKQSLPTEVPKLQELTILGCLNFKPFGHGINAILIQLFDKLAFEIYSMTLSKEEKAQMGRAVVEALGKIDKMPPIAMRQLFVLLNAFEIEEKQFIERYPKTQVPIALGKLEQLVSEGKSPETIEASFSSLRKQQDYPDYFNEMVRFFPTLTAYLIENHRMEIIPYRMHMNLSFIDALPTKERSALFSSLRESITYDRLLTFVSKPANASIPQMNWRT